MDLATILLFVGLAGGCTLLGLLLGSKRREKHLDAELTQFFAERTARRQREAEQGR